MKLFRILLFNVFIIFSVSIQANIDEFALNITEAKVLVQTRIYLKQVRDDLNKGKKLNKKDLLLVEKRVEQIAIHGCECEDEIQSNIIRSQAYALVGAINGVLSKDSKNISQGKKSYHSLVKARELDPTNTDAIKGQAVALKMILAKGWAVSRIVSLALGINLNEAKRDLIYDLRGFPERKDLQHLADQLAEI